MITVLGEYASDYEHSAVWIPITAPGLQCSEAQRVGLNVRTGKAVYQLKHPLERTFFSNDLYVIDGRALVPLTSGGEA